MSVTLTGRETVTTALQTLNVVMANELVSDPDATTAVLWLNLLFDGWNAVRSKVWAALFEEFTLVPSLSPHTIGPTGATFTTDQRPVSIDGCALILNNVSPIVKPFPMVIHKNPQWWSLQSTPTIETATPTDLYYQPDWPNGKLYFWPVPNVAYDVQLMTRHVLDSAVTLDTSLTYPPGYAEAVILTLTEKLAVPFGRSVPPEVTVQAREARTRIDANNDVPMRMITDDGMGRRARHQPDFFWPSGVIR